MSAVPEPVLPPALPLFADDPAHPWNRVHQALFAPHAKVKVVGCLLDRSCAVLPTAVGFFTEDASVPAEYADTPSQFMLAGVEQLLAAGRRERVLAALREALAVPPESQPVAAALLQNDLWERFDAIAQALAQPDGEPVSRAALHELREAIGLLLRHLALPAATLRAVPPNLQLLVAEHPDVLAGLTAAPSADGAGQWVEVVTRSAEQPRSFNPPLREGTRHSLLVGFRAVFRIYISVPAERGGAGWLQGQLARAGSSLSLPAGTRLAIAAQPLVMSREGEPEPLPLVTLLEARAVGSPAAPDEPRVRPGVTRLAELPFFVFEGKRQLLRAIAPGQPGLIRLDAAAPFPQGGTCAPRPQVLQPLRGVCLLCHQPDREHLTGTLSHGEQSLRVTSDPTAAARAVIASKRERQDFQELQAYFSR